jgi:hypothetical protein
MEVIKDERLYLDSILKEIDAKKEAGRKGVYRINEKITLRAARYVETYFKNNPGYFVSIKKCMQCRNEWDIIISWT